MRTHEIQFAAEGVTYQCCTACATYACKRDAGATSAPYLLSESHSDLPCELHYEEVCEDAH
jgi:hypothetical protein